MPHPRKRFLENILYPAIGCSPVVGLVGLRQVGKTTLVGDIVSKTHAGFETFDQSSTLDQSKIAPNQFLSRNKLLCLDEAQKAPWIFPVIKDLVGTKRKPGQFLLTGSIRFSLKKDIRESLTGRILTYELLPFSLAETIHQTPARFLQNVFHTMGKKNNPHQSLENFLQKNGKSRVSLPLIERYSKLGGMPVPCFARDEDKRQKWFREYFETLLSRDIVLADPSLENVSYQQGLRFIQSLALMCGEEIRLDYLANQSLMTRVMAKKMLQALVSLCLIEQVIPEKKAEKSVQKMKVEWKDTGLWYHALGTPQLEGLQAHKALHLLLSQEFRLQTELEQTTIFKSFYKTRDGGSIPWIFRQKEKTLALTYLLHENPKIYDYRSIKQFVKNTPSSMGIVLGPEKTLPGLLDTNLWHLPYTLVF